MKSKCPVVASDDSEIQHGASPYPAVDRPVYPSTQRLETRPAQRAFSSDDPGHDVWLAGRRHTGLVATEPSPVATVDPGPEIPDRPPGWVTKPRQSIGAWKFPGYNRSTTPSLQRAGNLGINTAVGGRMDLVLACRGTMAIYIYVNYKHEGVPELCDLKV